MARLFPKIYFHPDIVDADKASLSVASSAVLYGLSVYTVFNIHEQDGEWLAFRLGDHYKRLVDSCRIIGITTFENEWTYEQFEGAVRETVRANNPHEDVFVRASVHVDELLPGTRTKGLHTTLSLFLLEAAPIVPQEGMRLKTSMWRRIPDNAIPSRAKVNGAYVNSALARQDAMDAGYDDCVFLDVSGHVCELSAANIFLVRDGVLVTPNNSCDLLEGINRRTVLEIARDQGVPVEERTVDVTELYIADEVFVCGTSSYLAPVFEIDGRNINHRQFGPLTRQLREIHRAALDEPSEKGWLTKL